MLALQAWLEQRAWLRLVTMNISKVCFLHLKKRIYKKRKEYQNGRNRRTPQTLCTLNSSEDETDRQKAHPCYKSQTWTNKHVYNGKVPYIRARFVYFAIK